MMTDICRADNQNIMDLRVPPRCSLSPITPSSSGYALLSFVAHEKQGAARDRKRTGNVRPGRPAEFCRMETVCNPYDAAADAVVGGGGVLRNRHRAQGIKREQPQQYIKSRAPSAGAVAVAEANETRRESLSNNERRLVGFRESADAA
jgi:hypothetical protein